MPLRVLLAGPYVLCCTMIPAGPARLAHVDGGSLRHFDAVVVRLDGHGERGLDRCAPVEGGSADALERVVAAAHHEAAAVLGPVADHLQTVGKPLAALEGRRVEQQRVGTDVR